MNIMNILRQFGNHGIPIEIILSFVYLQVSYPSGVTVDFGNELTPTQVKDEPTVSWPADPNAFYTLCMTGNNTHYKHIVLDRENQFILNFVVYNKPYLKF